MKHLLKMSDLTREEITELLNEADQLKYELKHGIRHQHLKGKTLGMIFQKLSTRTRVSFEVGMCQLGGSALFLSARDLQVGRGEPIEDTARTLSRYVDGIMIRTYDQQEAEDLARFGSVPVINGLTDYSHPCQVLADLMTIREQKGRLEGVRVCYVGDGNNVCNSLVVGCLTMGMSVAAAIPEAYRPHPAVLEFAKPFGEAFRLTTDPREAARGADVVFTDAWVPMGREAEADERRRAFAPYQVNDGLLALCAPDVLVQHCLPARKGEEIAADTFEAHAAEIFDEAENRLHAQKAALVRLLSD